ncbi:MAG: dihydrofolate reductase family protein [Cyclobacteriaceae bacterium]
MRKIVYYVASTLDGYIAGPNGDVSQFMQEGEGVDQYLYDLQEFDTVIMGRKTYEFGYQFGLKPGQPAYPHMKHHVFSASLNFKESSEQVQVEKLDLEVVQKLKNGVGSEIYLCGGGEFAGWLLDNQMIDILKIKLNPVFLGGGTRLFGSSKMPCTMKMKDHRPYADGLQIMTFDLN